MVRRSNRRSIRRNRRPNRGLMRNIYGSTQSQPFQVLLSRFALTASAGLNDNVFTITQLMNGDLTTRQVRLMRVVVRFHPYNQSTTSGAHYSSQLQYVDPLSSSSTFVPISTEKPLSSTNITTFSGTCPLQSSWLPANSSSLVLNIPIWAESGLASGLFADIYTYWMVAGDNLT